MGSHGFLAAVMDESFATGIFAFALSNYTVVVWAVMDLAVILATRNLARLIEKLKEIGFRMGENYIHRWNHLPSRMAQQFNLNCEGNIKVCFK